MNTLEKFNKILDSIEIEKNKLESISNAYNKLKKLVEHYEDIQGKFKEYNLKLDKINGIHVNQQNKVNATLDQIESFNAKSRSEISKQINEIIGRVESSNAEMLLKNDNIIEQQFEKLLSVIEFNLNKTSSLLIEFGSTIKHFTTEFTSLFENRTDQLRAENKAFYRDFEGSIKIRIEDNKLETKKIIENERNEIKQIIVTEINKNNKELEQIIANEIVKGSLEVKQMIRRLQIYIIVIAGLTIAFGALAIKLWL